MSERLQFYRTARLVPDLELRTFFLTLFYTGCRISEALNMRRGDADLSDGTLVFRTLKQRQTVRYRALPVPDELLDLFEKLPVASSCNLEVKIWRFSRTTAWRRVKEQMDIAGLDGIKATPKGLRHGFAIASVSQSVPITTVQKWLGHAQIRTTSIYLDFVGSDERDLAKRTWPEATKTAI